MIVLLIVAIVSAVALPMILTAMSSRQVREASILMMGEIAGSRDLAIRQGAPSGFRLLPDPAFPLTYAGGRVDTSVPIVYNRVVPLSAAPRYSEGAVTVVPDDAWLVGVGVPPGRLARVHAPDGDPDGTGVVVPTLVLLSAPFDPQGLPNPPTSWAWNARVGDRVQIQSAGGWYTVVGPMWQPNAEGFVNFGEGGVSPLDGIEYLLLVNGLDDNKNGWIDEGWDGVNNNGDKAGMVDEYHLVIAGVVYNEWAEQEAWLSSLASGVWTSVPYIMERRPFPSIGNGGVALPTSVVIDLSRSNLAINNLSGTVDVIVNADGTSTYSMPYGVPSSLGMKSMFIHMALVDRSDIGTGTSPKAPWAMVTINTRTGRANFAEDPPADRPFSPGERGGP